jgi:hypothetical protein
MRMATKDAPSGDGWTAVTQPGPALAPASSFTRQPARHLPGHGPDGHGGQDPVQPAGQREMAEVVDREP